MSLPAGAALGSTSDPKALVIGTASTLDHQARALRTAASTMETVGDDLRAVRTPSWEGPASSAFWVGFATEPRTWFRLQTVLTDAAAALSDQAAALRTAQDRAQDAIDRWEKGEQATKSAVAAYNTEARRRAENAPVPGLSLPMAPFRDPGEALREEAEEILKDARDALDKAGLEAAGTLCELGGISWSDASGEVSGPGADASAKGPKFKYGRDNLFGGGNPPWQRPNDGKSKAEVTLAKVAADAYVAKLEGKVEGNYHGVDYKAGGNVKVLDVGAQASAGLTDDGAKASAGVHADLVNAHGETSAEYGIASVQAEVDASVGASAKVDAEVTKTSVHAGGEAFVGGKISGSAGGDVGGVGGQFTAEGWAGAGIGGDIDVGYHDGEFTFGGYGGVGLGFGGKLGGEFTVDPGEVLETGQDLVSGIGGLLD
ncbi:hypothetical protein ASG49_13525 [Marmoricola sp. Leaf446]|uniref:putative T7SS-secreted protein n=1 Tax=Marmoricola sp. Leaf446 TaxID=1736379 RepID=UPI0006FC387E|nr:hypothetical protein [Marmoricola sp. Leaf446]KQT90762.1 hypothetical protein ASG49_13525 [Marmoricola sp. Leaf446]